MAIEDITIDHFRNLLHVNLSPSPSINLIIGKNGSGKTSLLEAIYFLGTARSFRTPHTSLLINRDVKEFRVFSKIRKGDVGIGVGIARDTKHIKIKIAGHSVNSASQLAELLPVQLINPDIHRLLEEGPRYRRRFIEWGVFHVKPHYLPLWQQCIHILRQRNAALRQTLNQKELTFWDDALCDVSKEVTKIRIEYLKELQPHLDSLFTAVPDLPRISIKLDQGWSESKTLKLVLKDNLAADQKRGFTQYGPHRADLKITTGRLRAKDVVSRGQQKLITMLMKLAQLKCLIASQSTSTPVLLVDDLPAELDKDYREVVIKEIAAMDIQSFITSTELASLTIASPGFDYPVFHVKHGDVKPE
jgi:DNA replication and repair protein RecF